MRICHLELNNFRGIKNGCIALPTHSVILGPNNVGKSALAEALAVLVGREALTHPISDWDFHGGSPDRSSRLKIVVTITDFGNGKDSDPTHFPEWFTGERGAAPVWWDEKNARIIPESEPPEGAKLAARIAVVARYDDETCEFETIRFFFDEECDPFTEEHRPVPNRLLRDLGVFFLPSDRQWDRLLGFGSSTFLKVLREYGAIPGPSIDSLKRDLRTRVTKVEEAEHFKEILDIAERELKSFVMLEKGGRILYRPTNLDTLSVLRSLMPHVEHDDEMLIPVSRSGSGMIALQSFLLLLAFSEHRVKAQKNFILVADEPELHLHPSLHRRLVNRIRGSSTQSIVITQSPGIASAYPPTEVVYIGNEQGRLNAIQLRTEPIGKIDKSSVESLYLKNRETVYDALMGAVVVVPEGRQDCEWINLWQRIVEASTLAASGIDVPPLTVIPTSDGSIVETYQEIAKFRPDAIPLVDGDEAGGEYVARLAKLANPPRRIAQFGTKAASECLAAWIIEPILTQAPEALSLLLRDSGLQTLRTLQDALVRCKKDMELHENLAWTSIRTPESVERARGFLADLALISTGKQPVNTGWVPVSFTASVTIFTATHIKRE